MHRLSNLSRSFYINRAFTPGQFRVQWYDGKAMWYERYVPWYKVPVAMLSLWWARR